MVTPSQRVAAKASVGQAKMANGSATISSKPRKQRLASHDDDDGLQIKWIKDGEDELARREYVTQRASSDG